MEYFGARWDAPAFDDAVQVGTPVGGVCFECDELIVDGDAGVVVSYVTAGPILHRVPVHLECHLRSTLGSVAHLEERCSCYGGVDIDNEHEPHRDEARKTMAWLVARGGRFVVTP